MQNLTSELKTAQAEDSQNKTQKSLEKLTSQQRQQELPLWNEFQVGKIDAMWGGGNSVPSRLKEYWTAWVKMQRGFEFLVKVLVFCFYGVRMHLF